ncbi:Zn-dependent hydrolase [Aliidiomarina minuta]|uniref:Zn-dependent hydrolase n=1 Tax=Aliidiomarina minuta TaxID=880057 RepID=A0A432WBS6_9GAMM|nr:Zn-dependent hydrolase [Aliidiomarina minuta]RUO27048.1 Zn-dependent hydrolase [Aliidiomarina minuta]
MYNIDLPRLKSTLLELSQIGFNEEDHGMYRQGFTDDDMKARHWLLDMARKEGFIADMDGAGNVWFGLGELDKPAVIIGSHLDTVPAGGIFDGALGVIAGLEVLRVIKDNNIQLDFPLRVVGTAEEEGRFGGMFGAQSITGKLNMDWLLSARDADGMYLTDAMKNQGLNPMDALEVAWPQDRIKNFFELHIEQGPVLEKMDIPIGIVDGISGVFKWIVHLKGKADHAGTAPMDMRSDAFMGLADFAHEITRIIDENGTDKTRITVGKVQLKPGYPHTVPGEAIFTIVGRDMSEDIMRDLADVCDKTLNSIARRHRLRFEREEASWLPPHYCTDSMIELMEQKAQDRGWPFLRMPSGAGHDVQFFTEVTEAGLIFIPSVNGVSHAPDEWSHWHHVEKGANLLLDCVLDKVSKD